MVTTENGRATKLGGDPDDPITQGFLCERTLRFLDRQYALDRLTQPMLRIDGVLTPVSWDRALDVAAEHMLRFREESGGASIFHYRSGGSLGVLKQIPDYLFSRFGPISKKRGDICSGAGDYAQTADFGKVASPDMADLAHSRLIVLWGKNPHTSGVHLLPFLQRARRNGAKIIVIDPVRTKAAISADLFLQPAPGRDYAVAMGMLRWIIDAQRIDPKATTYCDNFEEFCQLAKARPVAEWAQEADLSSEELSAAAELYSEQHPAAILFGWGLGRRRNGAATMRAIDGLATVMGQMGLRGGGASFGFDPSRAYDKNFGQEPIEPARTFPEPLFGPCVLEAQDPPVRMIWVTAGNPVAMLPDSDQIARALDKTEFVVVVDTHPTDTTDHADLVLPTLTLLEDSDLHAAFGNNYLRASQAVLTPPGEARHELEIIQGLAERLGLGEELKGSVNDWKRRAMHRLEEKGVQAEDLQGRALRNPFAPVLLFEGSKFATPNSKAHLMVEAAAAPRNMDDSYPLTLMATSTPKAQSSQWASTNFDGPAPVRVHPMAAEGIADGAHAFLESDLARLEVRVVHDATMRPDLALMEKGGQLRNDRGVNRLVRAELTDFGEGGSLYDQPVRLVP